MIFLLCLVNKNLSPFLLSLHNSEVSYFFVCCSDKPNKKQEENGSTSSQEQGGVLGKGRIGAKTLISFLVFFVGDHRVRFLGSDS